MATPAVVGSALGFPANFGQHIQNVWTSNQGDAVTVSPVAGNTLVVVVFGLDTYNPFDLLHTGNTNPAYLPDLLSFNAPPIVTDSVVDAATITNSQEDSVALTLTAASQPAGPFTLTSVANAVASSTTYTGTITGGGANAYAGFTFTIAGFTNAANNGAFLCTASTGTTLVLTSSAGVSETHAATATGPTGFTTYTGTITGGAANALVGYFFQIAGFTTGANNGYFLCTASTATILTLVNAAGVSETHAGTATPNIVTITAANNFNVGDVIVYSGLTTATWLNGQSQAIVTVSGTTFTTNDSTKHATNASHADTGKATRSTGNDWVAAGGQLSMGDSDYTASLGDFTRSVKWSLDGFFPSIYMFYALNVTGGTYKVIVNTSYQDGIARPADLAAGKPIFDGGVDIHVIELSGIVLSAASDGATGGMSAANPAVAPTFTPTQNGDLILTAGLMKSANAFSTNAAAGTTGTVMLASGKCVASEAHWGIQFQLQTTAAAITPGFTNPLGYEMAVKTLALKHS